ncbi:hypothetical protein F3Y22_tig00110511pilonHSYRG00130 [Hibiscus syriacus]|uniref:Uncharacterized protein n=1 Tax=Hibiscus syriacus TaxID=106335 RepID=A0A6A3AB66_HIBSY|nr:hypothetical protein F3Y22_tig00110511pilonHSYRG00130 [Hibiscus syriacus]
MQFSRLDFNFTTNDIQFKAQIHREGAIHNFNLTAKDINLKAIQFTRLDFNFRTKDIQFKAQLHNEGATYDFDFTTNNIVPKKLTQLHEEGVIYNTTMKNQFHTKVFESNFSFTAKYIGLEDDSGVTFQCFESGFNFTMKDIVLRIFQFKAQLHNEGATHNFNFMKKDIVPNGSIQFNNK